MPQGVDKGAVRSCIQRLTAAAQRLKEAQERFERAAKESEAAQKAPGGQPAVGASDPTFAFGALASARTTAEQELNGLRQEAERHLNEVRRGVAADGQDISTLERAVSEVHSGRDGLNAARGAARQDRRELEELQREIERALQAASSAQQSGGSGGSPQSGGSSGSPYLSSGFSSRPSLVEQYSSTPPGGRRVRREGSLETRVESSAPGSGGIANVVAGVIKAHDVKYRRAAAHLTRNPTDDEYYEYNRASRERMAKNRDFYGQAPAYGLNGHYGQR